MVSYRREFGSTHAQYAYTPPLLLAKILQSNDAIEYSCDSQHGVWGVDFTRQLERAGAYTEFVEQQLAGVDPLSMHGSLSASGKITQSLEFDAIANLDVDGQSVSTPRAIVTIEINQAMSALAFNGQIDPFEVENENRRFSLGEFNFTGDLEAIADVFMVGDFAMSLDKFSLKNADNEIALVDFSVVSESVENGDNVDSYSIVKIASLEISDTTDPCANAPIFGRSRSGIEKTGMSYSRVFSQVVCRLTANCGCDDCSQPPDRSHRGSLPTDINHG